MYFFFLIRECKDKLEPFLNMNLINVEEHNSYEPYDLIAKSLPWQGFSSAIPFNKWPMKTQTKTLITWTTDPEPVWQKYLILALSEFF